MRIRTWLYAPVAGLLVLGSSGTYWIAHPTHAASPLPAPLKPFDPRGNERSAYSKDFESLSRSFRPQAYRSFCGPASIATVLRAYGVRGADQTSVFPTWLYKIKTFYSGMTLAELEQLARSDGLLAEAVYADALTLDDFRQRLKENLAREGDYVLVNYDRRALSQSGIGHISPVALYDERNDAFLVLDEAGYRYPFTWIPTRMLYSAVHTRDGSRFRGVLFINGHRDRPH